MKKFIIDVRGSSCAGKSTLIKNFLETQKPVMHISIDRIKWFFNDYLDHKPKYQKILGTMVVGMIDESLKNDISVIFEGSQFIDSNKLKEIAENHSAELYRINVEADYKVLLERFHERIENVKAEGRVIGNMEESGLRKIYDNYFTYKKPGLELDSGEMSEDEMLEKLLGYIK